MDRISKRKRRILKPFAKNQQLFQRLQRYVGNKNLNKSNKRLLESEFDRSYKKAKRQDRADADEEFDDQGFNKGFEFSDSEQTPSSEESANENIANTSLRSVYFNSEAVTSTPSSAPPSFSNSPIKGRIELNANEDAKSFRVQNQEISNPPEKYPLKKKNTSHRKSCTSKEFSNDLETKQSLKIPIQQSLVTFADVGGLENTLTEICMLLLHLKHPDIYQKIGVKNPPRGFLLHGPPGCGKTLIAHAIAGELSLPFIKVAATELVSGVSGESESKIRDLFDGAVSSAPCILFIDEIDAITPKREIAQREMEKRIVTQLLKCMDELNMMDASTQVMVIGATNRPHSLDTALRRAGRFDREISIGIPDEKSRLKILKVVCNELRFAPDFDLSWLARHTPGYVGADLMAITREAANNAISRIFQSLGEKTDHDTSELSLEVALSKLKESNPISETELEHFFVETRDFESALRVYVPSAKREGFATIPNVTWKDVGALKDVQRALQTSILWPIKYRKEFSEFHLTSPTGILLCGPKGCGKTLLAKAVANECSINFLSVKGPELLSMYVGESERAVRECFQRARNSAPCVIFFDEIDALCPARSSTNENAAAERVVNQLLTEIDGIEGRKQIFVMGATNRPENIDSAMLRPGRFEKIIFVGVPNQIDRFDILKTITTNGTKPKLSESVSLEGLSSDSRCEGFSGADLTSLVREASFKAFEDYITLKNENISENNDFEIKQEHFNYAFSNVRASVSDKDQVFFKSMNLFSPGKDSSFTD